MQTDWMRRFQDLPVPVLSVYVNSPQGQNASARLSDLLRPVRQWGESGSLDRESTMALRGDVKAVLGLADRLDAETAPGVAIFAAGGDTLEYLPTPAPVWDVAMVGNHPYVRPLRAVPPTPRTGVVVSDRRRAEIFIKYGDQIDLVATIEEEPGHKPNYGGWQGYDERRARASADVIAVRHYRRATERLFAIHQRSPLTLLAVGGHQETNDELVPELHPYLAAILAGTFIIDPRTMTPAIVRERVADLERAAVRAREEALLGEFQAVVGAGGLAVTGLAEVLGAVNARAVSRLLVAGTFAKPGVVCRTCHWLGRDGDACPVCAASLVPTKDIVAEAMEKVLEEGGSVHQVSVASPLDARGTGAFLRFALPDGVV